MTTLLLTGVGGYSDAPAGAVNGDYFGDRFFGRRYFAVRFF